MSKTLAMVRRRLNNHNPVICKIPPEILTMIASHLKVHPPLITKATHVCHHWRATLISCPNLWTHLNFAQENRALSFLHRSEAFPIHVDLISISPSQSLIELLCLHSARINTLRVGRFDGLRKLFRLPLASLKTLEVATPDEWSQVLVVRSAAKEFLTLTSLILGLNPGALTFRGSRITRLRVKISGPDSLAVAELLSLFRSCTLLEELVVENEAGLDGGSLVIPDDIIPLPHLRSFVQMLRHDRHIAGILDCFHLPPSCLVVLRCMAGHTYDYPLLGFPILRDTSYFTNIKRAKLVYAAGFLGRKAGVTWDIINDTGTRFIGAMDFINHATSLFEMGSMESGGIGLSMPVVEVLCVDGHRYVPLVNLQRLTTLVLSGTVVRLYLEILTGYNAYRSIHTLVLFVVPSLLTSDLVTRLFSIARVRARAGFPLKTITFACPSVLTPYDLTALEGLKEYVERVELLLGDDALDWNLDKYFLNGF